MADYSKIPQELKDQRQWCVYRLVQDDERPGKAKKLPLQSLRPNTGCATTRPEEWSTFDEAVACSEEPSNKMSGIGFVLTPPYIGTDFDNCFQENQPLPVDSVLEYLKDLDSYTEKSPSGKGLHVITKGKLPAGARKDGIEVYTEGRYFTMTGKALWDKPVRTMSDAEAIEHYEKVKRGQRPEAQVSERKTKLDMLMAGDMQAAGFTDPSAAVQSLLTLLAQRHRFDKEKIEQEFLSSKLYLVTASHWQKKWDRLRDRELNLAVENARRMPAKPQEIDPDSWREGCKSFGQLSEALPKFLIGGLVPEKALTAICAPSYNCKTWLALAIGKAISTGEPLWCFDGPAKPTPCIYHVPEMNEALVRQYMVALGFEDSDMFLVRPMETGLWPLDDPRMLRSSQGRMNFFDTAGYFNPADDSSNYAQSLQFAKLIYNLLNNGAMGVCGLFHPPKYAKQDRQAWSLENSILGSAGYGGILRSCLRMQNLNSDLNDSNVWVYVEGMKNPGLKPFQLEGPMQLKMKVPPGESPWLKDLNLDEDPRRPKAFVGFAEGKTAKVLAKELKASESKISQWRKEWREINSSDEESTEKQTEFNGGGF